MRAACKAPVLLVGYNRPECIRQVVESLAAVQPPLVFVAVDGPNDSRPQDPARCEAVARIVVEGVTWPCDLRFLRRERHLGCACSMSEAITWFFEHVEAGIILEDDIVPTADFFHLCEELLDRYRDDERVWSVTGSSYQDGDFKGEASYFFSKYAESWGWASWRRAWRHYRPDFPEVKTLEGALWWQTLFPDPVEALYWQSEFEAAVEGRVDSWYYRWICACFQHGGLTATPFANLVSNIGFGNDATHTKDAKGRSIGRPTGALGELRHPARVTQCVEADAITFPRRHCIFGSSQERQIMELLIRKRGVLNGQLQKQHRRLQKDLLKIQKQLRAAEKERDKLAGELRWAAGHRWKTVRRLLTGRWPK